MNMNCAASVSYNDLINELQRRQKTKHKWDDCTYVDSLVFDLHMAQKCLQRAIYNQQVTAVDAPAPCLSLSRSQSRKLKLQSQLNYPDC